MMLIGSPRPYRRFGAGRGARDEGEFGPPALWFDRSFSLPPEVDPGKIKAELKDGVLHLSLPKSEKARKETRKFPINTA